MKTGATILLLSLVLATPAGAQEASSDRRDDGGAVCLYIALRSLDVEVSGPEEIRERIGSPSEGGLSLDQLAETAATYGVQTRAVETSADNLLRRSGRFACIAHYDEGHFVNLINVEQGRVHVIDAPRSMQVPVETFDMVWSRKALLISAAPILAEEDLPVEWNWAPWLYAALAVCATLVVVWWRRRRKAANKSIEST